VRDNNGENWNRERERRDVNNGIMGWGQRVRWLGLFYRGRVVDKERVNLK